MLVFWRTIFYSSFLSPIFNLAAKALGVTPQVCKEYCTSGMMLYGLKWFFIVLLVIALIVLIKLFGYLNLGNFSKISKDKADNNSSLKGKSIIFLGSSVTKGFAAYNHSFVDMIKNRTGANVIKEAVSGTTLIENGNKSYIARLKALDTSKSCDLFVCQLSTNDATFGSPLGAVSDSTDLQSFDTKTVIGAIEYICSYVKENWNCPIMFYTNPRYNDERYGAMVEALHQVAEKWQIGIIDFWNNKDVNQKFISHFLRNDNIHPTKKGYDLLTPHFEKGMEEVLSGKAVSLTSADQPADLNKMAAERSKKGGKIMKGLLSFLIAIVSTVGLSTYEQLIHVKGLNNEGNSEKYDPENVQPNSIQPIAGKKLLWLGSSVFQGFGAGNNSPALWIDALDGTYSTTEVKGGTFLASIEGEIGGGYNTKLDPTTSYTNRLKTHTKETDPGIDLVLVQLSTNDSKGQCEVGEVSDSFESADFDILTTTGSLEAITAYAKSEWGARVLVITGTEFADEMTRTGGQKAEIYLQMIEKCHELDEKWGDQFSVLDLWHNEKIYEGIEMGDDLWRSYMSDAIHPTKKGYLLWWGPYIEEKLYEMLG